MNDLEYSRDKYETQHEVKSFYRFLIKSTANAAAALRRYRTEKDLEAQEEFKSWVDSPLTVFYFNKFKKSDNVSKPDIFEDEDAPPNMNDASFEECKKVYFRIIQLQEDLGHTSLESLNRGRRQV